MPLPRACGVPGAPSGSTSFSTLTRSSDPGDRRVNRLHVTDTALPILERLGVFADREHYFADVGLPPEKLAQLTALLDEVIENLSA